MLRLIMSDVAVVAVGDEASGSGTSNIALSVYDVKAAQLAFTADNGKIWLVLRPAPGCSRPVRHRHRRNHVARHSTREGAEFAAR